ncbi:MULTISPECIES: DUF561 domain-containing protein [Prochlorococcus]|uniref:DUF561 domain-containing protein n=1 Tax=Prochlorococcus TaxID=1218 RepID=UPI0005617D8D|nr:MULTISPECIES: DUF561 domain-containing protein [Prochlorococcus]
MSRLQKLPFSLQKSLKKGSLLKIIGGLDNFDEDSVVNIAKASALGGGDLIDIACDAGLVKAALQVSSLPVCVSAVDPQLFPSAVEAGASLIEIGNFDSFYAKGRFFESAEVLALTTETRRLIPDVFLSVTVPHFLPLDQQAQLGLDLVEAGADLIQTEGGKSSTPHNPGVRGLIEKAAPTLAAVHTISQAFSRADCQIPIMCASGLSAVTAPLAIAAGASGVGIGSAVNRLSSEIEMIAMIKTLRESIDYSPLFVPQTA